MKSVVIYKSKTGFVKKYAQWIAEDLDADIFEASNISIEQLKSYDKIIYGGGLYAVGINGVKLITNNLDKLKGKKLIVFASGATPPREKDIRAVRDQNFTPNQQDQIAFFYLRGGFDYSKLGLIDKILMTLLKLKLKLKNKDKMHPDEKGMLAAYEKSLDFTRKENLRELLLYVKE